MFFLLSPLKHDAGDALCIAFLLSHLKHNAGDAFWDPRRDLEKTSSGAFQKMLGLNIFWNAPEDIFSRSLLESQKASPASPATARVKRTFLDLNSVDFAFCYCFT